ncbi:MAG: helix-turn-helix transcriptional regulator [Acidobacteriota bacterium]
MIGTQNHKQKTLPFGKRLAAARIAKGWSQTELADRLNSTLKMIDYYERRANNPSVEFVRLAAWVLGVSMAELLGEDVQIKRASKTGPTGKVHKIFEEVSKLPRRNKKRSLRSSPRSSASMRRADSEWRLLVEIRVRCWR